MTELTKFQVVMGQGFWDVVPPRIDKITRGEGANLGGCVGTPRIGKFDRIDKMLGGVSRFWWCQVIEACTGSRPPMDPPCLNRDTIAINMGKVAINRCYSIQPAPT